MELSVRFLEADPGSKVDSQASALCQSREKNKGSFGRELQLPMEHIINVTVERQAWRPVRFEIESQMYNLLAEL